MHPPTHYQLLGVEPSATVQQIRAAYRRLAKSLHPDVNREPDAQARFARLAAAYEVLSDRARRRDYDAELRASTQPPVDTRAHYTWTNIATETAAKEADRLAEFEELYDTFFRPHPPAEP